MKNKKNLIIYIILGVLILAGIVAIILIIPKKNKKGNEPDEKFVVKTDADCIYQGKVCNSEDIGQGIPITYQVNDETSLDFYVLSNDETTLTLISKEPVTKSTWSRDPENFAGPEPLLKALYEATKDWNNAKPLKYTYKDEGYQRYESLCLDKTEKDSTYDCNFVKDGVGYISLTYDEKGVRYLTAYNKVNTISTEPAYARTITEHDLIELFVYNKEITWLQNIEPAWTATSATDSRSGYYHSGKTLKNTDKTSTGLEVSFADDLQELNVYAVINIDKQIKDAS